MVSVKHIDVTEAINHGNGYSHATLVVIIIWREGEICKKDEESFALDNVKCTKDNAIILRENFDPRLNERIKKYHRLLLFQFLRVQKTVKCMQYMVANLRRSDMYQLLLVSRLIHGWLGIFISPLRQLVRKGMLLTSVCGITRRLVIGNNWGRTRVLHGI